MIKENARWALWKRSFFLLYMWAHICFLLFLGAHNMLKEKKDVWAHRNRGSLFRSAALWSTIEWPDA